MENLTDFIKRVQESSDAEIIDLFLGRYDLVEDSKIEVVVQEARKRALIDSENRMLSNEQRTELLEKIRKQEEVQKKKVIEEQRRKEFGDFSPSRKKYTQNNYNLNAVQIGAEKTPAHIRLYCIIALILAFTSLFSLYWIPFNFLYFSIVSLVVTRFHYTFIMTALSMASLYGMLVYKRWGALLYIGLQILDILSLIQYFSFTFIFIKIGIICFILYYFQEKMPEKIRLLIQNFFQKKSN